jgi:hypothetical protein
MQLESTRADGHEARVSSTADPRTLKRAVDCGRLVSATAER